MKKIVLYVCMCLLHNTSLLSLWDPEFCFPEASEIQIQKLSEKKYINLKQEIKKYLKNSWCSSEKIDLLMDLTIVLQPKVCVEIGAFTGSSVLPVAIGLKHQKFGKVYAIDAWSNDEAVRYLDENDPNRIWWLSVNMNEAYSSFTKLIKAWGVSSFSKVLRYPSEKAVDMLKDIDFINIDGNFSEVGSLKDVQLYLPKVKSGGYILLSNYHLVVNENYSKIKSYSALHEACDVVYEIENENAILFRKR